MCDTEQHSSTDTVQTRHPASLQSARMKTRPTPSLLPSNSRCKQGCQHQTPCTGTRTTMDFNWGWRLAGLCRTCAPWTASLPCPRLPPASRHSWERDCYCHTSHTAPGGFSWEATGSSFRFCRLFTFQDVFPFAPPLV